MDDIGNIIYVIAVIGYLIYRAVGGGKKKPTQQPSQAPKRKGTTIEDILKELNQQMETDPEPDTQPEPVQARPLRSMERTDPHRGHVHKAIPFLDVDNPHRELASDYKMSSSEMGSHRIKRKEMKNSGQSARNSLSEYVNELENEVDLKRAIIYQAILETPYIQRV